MRNSNVLTEQLRSIGLTSYESEAYVALLQKRELTAEELSESTSVPITRVYGTLEQLTQKGFARIIHGRPKRFHAVPPDEAKREYLTNLRRNFETDLLTIEETMKHLQRQIDPIYVQSHLQVKPEELVEPLEDLKVMERRTADYVNESSKEVLISTALFSWLPKIKNQLHDALSRGVNVRVLMQSTQSPVIHSLQDLRNRGAHVRDTADPWHPVRGTLVDDKDLIFVIWAAEETERHWNPIVYTPNHTKNPGLIRIFRESFMFRWNNSKRMIAPRMMRQ
jgi:sugar-specific transcriptional regulator TrmB